MSQNLNSIPKPPKKLTKSGKRMYRAIAQSLLDRESLFEKHRDIIFDFVEHVVVLQEWRRQHRNTIDPRVKGQFNKDLDSAKEVAKTAFGLDEDELAKIGVRFPKKL